MPPSFFFSAAGVLRHLKPRYFYHMAVHGDSNSYSGGRNSYQDDINAYQDGPMMEGQEFVWA